MQTKTNKQKKNNKTKNTKWRIADVKTRIAKVFLFSVFGALCVGWNIVFLFPEFSWEGKVLNGITKERKSASSNGERRFFSCLTASPLFKPEWKGRTNQGHTVCLIKSCFASRPHSPQTPQHKHALSFASSDFATSVHEFTMIVGAEGPKHSCRVGRHRRIFKTLVPLLKMLTTYNRILVIYFIC